MNTIYEVSEAQMEELVNLVEHLGQVLLQFPIHSEAHRLRLRLEKAIWEIQFSSLTTLIPKLQALVAQTAQSLKKEVNAQFIGFDVSVPSHLIETIADALIHCVRNAIDHGIELPSVRQSRGKPPSGGLTFKVSVSSAKIVVTVQDDGQGPDLTRILHSATARGLVPEAQAPKISPSQILDLIFEPGLSTRDLVSKTSGRGVGLEAVRSLLSKVGGAASARALAPGQGLAIALQLPVRALGCRALPVYIGKQCFWIFDHGFEEAPDQGLGAPSSEERIRASKLLGVMGWHVGSGPRWIRLIDSLPSFCLPVDRMGEPELKLFRILDPIWGSTGSGWIQAWLRAAGGQMLASGAGGQSFIAPLADAETLAKIII